MRGLGIGAFGASFLGHEEGQGGGTSLGDLKLSGATLGAKEKVGVIRQRTRSWGQNCYKLEAGADILEVSCIANFLQKIFLLYSLYQTGVVVCSFLNWCDINIASTITDGWALSLYIWP